MVSRILIKGGSYCCGLWGWRVMATPQDLVEVVSADPGPRERRACAESCFPWDAFVGDLISPRPFPLCLWSLQRFFLAGPGEFTAAIPAPPMLHEEPETLECGQRGLGSRKGPRPNGGTENLLSFLKFMVGSICLS